jgi:hypothetical protein
MSASRNLEPLDDLPDSGDGFAVAGLDEVPDGADAVKDCRVVPATHVEAEEGEATAGHPMRNKHCHLSAVAQRLFPAVCEQISHRQSKVLRRHLQDATDGDPFRRCQEAGPHGDEIKIGRHR